MPSEKNKQTEAKKPTEAADVEKVALENATVATQMETVKKEDRLAENANASLLNYLTEYLQGLHKPGAENGTVSAEETARAIENTYPAEAERLSEELQNAKPGTPAYRENMELLTVCNTSLAVARQYMGLIDQDVLPADTPAKAGDPLETVQETLACFSRELLRVPKSGRNSMAFTEFYNVLEDASNGHSLEHLYEKASAYIKKGEGFFSGSATNAGRHRMEMAKRVCEFLDNVNYKSYEPEIQQKLAERDAEIRVKLLEGANDGAAASRLGDKVMDKIYDTCVDLHAAGKLEREQRVAIVEKAKSCTFGQKEFILKLLETDNWLKGFLANGSTPAEIDKNLDRVLNGDDLEISADEAVYREYERQTGAPQEELDPNAENFAQTDIDTPDTEVLE